MCDHTLGSRLVTLVTETFPSGKSRQESTVGPPNLSNRPHRRFRDRPLRAFPEKLAAPELEKGSFARISVVHLDLPLFWQCWKVDSPMLRRNTDAGLELAWSPYISPSLVTIDQQFPKGAD